MRTLTIIVIAVVCLPLISAVIFIDSTFNGNFNNTFFNSSIGAVQLNSSSGFYISGEIDAGRRSTWNNISWTKDTGSILVIVDKTESIYKSTDWGSNWSLINDSFSDVTNDAVDIININNIFYIINKKEQIWKSTNYGRSWTKVNNDYNGGEGNDAKAITHDNSNIYIIEGDEDVWRSNDSGLNWTKVNDDFDNGGSSSDAKGAAVDSQENIYVVAKNAKIYKSSNDGINWTLLTDDYNGADGNSANDMTSIGNTLFIMRKEEIWRSNNSGINWTKVSDDFNPGDGNDGKAITSDINNNLYIADSSEDIYKSSDLGITWTLTASNINGGNGDIKGMTSYNLSGIKLQVFTYDNNTQSTIFYGPGNSSLNFFTNSSFNNLQIPPGRYFKYKAFFETPDSDYSPLLYNVTTSYTEQYNAPYSPNINSPANNTIITINNSLLNVTIKDPDGDNMTIYFYGDEALLNTQYGLNGSTLTYNWTNIQNGSHNWSVIVFDGTFNISSGILNLNINTAQITPSTSNNVKKNNYEDSRERYEGISDRRFSVEGLEKIAPTKSIRVENNIKKSPALKETYEISKPQQKPTNPEHPSGTKITGSAVTNNKEYDNKETSSTLGFVILLIILATAAVSVASRIYPRKISKEKLRIKQINRDIFPRKNLLDKIKSFFK